APPGARQEAAAAQAAYTALKALYPSQAAALDAQLTDSLANTPGSTGNSVSIARGRAWGEHVANVILAWRSTDGWSTPPPPCFGGPRVWLMKSASPARLCRPPTAWWTTLGCSRC